MTVLGAPYESAGGSDAGAVCFLSGPPSGTVDLSLTDAMLVGEDYYDTAGVALWGGDLDGDELGDVLVGAMNEDAGGSSAGAVYVQYGGGMQGRRAPLRDGGCRPGHERRRLQIVGFADDLGSDHPVAGDACYGYSLWLQGAP